MQTAISLVCYAVAPLLIVVLLFGAASVMKCGFTDPVGPKDMPRGGQIFLSGIAACLLLAGAAAVAGYAYEHATPLPFRVSVGVRR